MRKSYKAILFASTLALGLGLGSCSKSDGNEPNPSPVNPTTSPQLISASEAQVNNKSISILRSAAEQKLKVKQISTLAGGTGGYNVLLSDERLVQIYIAGTARSLRQGTSSNTEQNPVAAVDFAQKGKAIFTLLDKSKIELDRTDANESGTLAAAQSVAPESKFLFTLLLDDEQLLGKTHTKAKVIEILRDNRIDMKLSYNEQGLLKEIMDYAYNMDGSIQPLGLDEARLTWSGERLEIFDYTSRESDGRQSDEDIYKLILEYNSANQAVVKSLTHNGLAKRAVVSYQPQERTITVLSGEGDEQDKTVHTYNEYYQLVKEEDYDILASGAWELDEIRTFEYNQQGDLAKTTIRRVPSQSGASYESETTYKYEYDAKGNWTKRTETYKRLDYTTDIDTYVLTRRITY